MDEVNVAIENYDKINKLQIIKLILEQSYRYLDSIIDEIENSYENLPDNIINGVISNINKNIMTLQKYLE